MNGGTTKIILTSSDQDKVVKISLLLMRIFAKFVKGKYVNFSVFEIFGDSTFYDYLKSTLLLMFEIFDFVRLIKNF